MNDNRKMNLPYKLAVIFLALCLPVFGGSLILAYIVVNINASVICSALGVALAVAGIILASVSKEKQPKVTDECSDDFVENKIGETIDKI